MEKVIFLDRDGTINIEKNYVYKIEDFEFEYKVIDALKIFIKLGYKIIIITNQSGIARGFYKKKDVEILNDYLINFFVKEEIVINEIYFCPHHEKGIEEYRKKCKCRKPGIDFYEIANKKYKIDYFNSYMVGDKLADLEAAIRLGIKPILVKTGHGKKELEKIYFKTEIFKNLYEFALSLL